MLVENGVVVEVLHGSMITDGRLNGMLGKVGSQSDS